MSVSAGVAAAAAAQSAMAAAEAHAARVVACRTTVKGFTHEMSSVQQRQEYAACVETLYPQPMAAADVMWWKGAVALLFIGLVGGGVRGWRDLWASSRIEGTVMGTIFGLLAAAGVIGAVAGVWFGVKFLLS